MRVSQCGSIELHLFVIRRVCRYIGSRSAKLEVPRLETERGRNATGVSRRQVLPTRVDGAAKISSPTTKRERKRGRVRVVASRGADGRGQNTSTPSRPRKRLVASGVELLLDSDSHFPSYDPGCLGKRTRTSGPRGDRGWSDLRGRVHDLRQRPHQPGGLVERYSLDQTLRAGHQPGKRLPLINSSSRVGRPARSAEVFIPGQVWSEPPPTLAHGHSHGRACFGNSTAGGAYVPAMCDYSVMVKERAKVFLGGPPLVKMATGEESTDEELGGAEMHSRISGLSDYFANDELDALRIGREIVAHLNWRKLGYVPRGPDDPIMTKMRYWGVSRRTSGSFRHARDLARFSTGPLRGVQGAVRTRW